MGKINTFTFISVDGFFAGPNGEIDWFKAIGKDEEFDAYTHSQATSEGSLIFGRTTYEMMKSYWPTPEAIKADPGMAKAVDESAKIVFSKTLKSVEEGQHWKKIRLFREINPEEVKKLKKESDMTILGSGSVVQQLANLGLIDNYTLAVVPMVLGAGKPLFKGVKKTDLKLIEVRAFKNGVVLLRYQPVKDK